MEEKFLDKEFSNDEEVDKETASFSNRDIKVSMTKLDKLAELMYVYKVLKYMLKDVDGAEVSVNIDEPFRGSGDVMVKATDLVFWKTQWFTKAIELSDNFEVYPRVDGTFIMAFAFNHLTDPAHSEDDLAEEVSE